MKDGLVWILSFLVTLLFEIQYGLLVAVVLQLLALVVRFTQRSTKPLVQVGDIFRIAKYFPDNQKYHGIIWQLVGSLT